MTNRTLLLIACATSWMVVAGFLGVASASDALPLGGGAGITVNGGNPCTLATIGHDHTGDLIGFTAARCGAPGSQVTAQANQDHGTVGVVVAANDDLDYAVIRFDPAKVIPLANFAGFTINGIGPDPSFGQPACTEGGATGAECGLITVPGRGPSSITANLPAWDQGDKGAPVTVEDQLVGITLRAAILPPAIIAGPSPGGQAHTRVGLFSAILNDVSSRGGPGAGFAPVPM